MITIIYDFDDNTYDFETELKEYKEQLTNEEICDLAKELFNSIDEIEKEDLVNEFGEESTSFDPNSEASVNLSKSIIYDADDEDIYKLNNDDIKDFYEDEAREEYDDYVAYNKDRYGYYGVSRRDFF